MEALEWSRQDTLDVADGLETVATLLDAVITKTNAEADQCIGLVILEPDVYHALIRTATKLATVGRNTVAPLLRSMVGLVDAREADRREGP